MSLDIGAAFGEGVDRTFARNGLLLAAAFAVAALLLAVFAQTLYVGAMEATLEWIQGLSPQELGIDQQEYEQMVTDMEEGLSQAEEMSPLALGIPLGAAAAGLVLVAIVSEALSIVAVRVFATDGAESPSREAVTDGLLLATLNGFVGSIVVWGLIIVGLVFLVVPGLFFAVAFYFVRQEIALKDKNFVQAMADSWRFTKGHRIEVFALGAAVVIISLLGSLASGVVEFVSVLAAQFVSALLGGLLGVFGAAVVTRAYVQLDAQPEPVDEAAEEDPYDAALGPDDIPE